MQLKADLESWLRRLGKSVDGWLMRSQFQDELWYEIIPIRLDPSRDRSYDFIIPY